MDDTADSPFHTEPQTGSGSEPGSKAAEMDRRVAAAAMRLAAEQGWSRTGLLDIARAADLSAAAFYQRYPDRADVLAAVSRTADMAVLADDQPPDPALDSGESARDRLFDVMMRRYDALQPYRDGLRVVMRDLRGEPLTALAFSRQFGRSMAWMLRAAGVEADRLGGAVLTAGLGAVQARVMRVFLDDDTADLSRTMAALDAELRRAERWAGTLRRRPRRSQPVEPPAGAIDPAI
ncbi:TetR family transcriptional regulator [Azospirillum rugosum]|uniref:AcrR family transcriptional regulator n=1 Tax=Azospirillum rugosum TaxID=416170 RepID=A0ABS4SPP3_9PROT|nr:TetR family transcriptional regulator [Azospirillum rugosum]MBP2294523.1 AcrR family transcriptional regulator [Azospirillum rugosum]MDQ0529028.1 AcrR family transcriptional regulator [Azospirillum rugosum]